MHRTLAYGYLIFGFLLGIGYSVGMEGSAASIEERFGYFLAGLVMMSFWQWFESLSHWRHLNRWNELKAKGKRRFVLVRYLLGRGFVFLVGTIGVVLLLKNLAGGACIALATVIAAILCLLVWIGTLEWSACEEDDAALRSRSDELGQGGAGGPPG